MTTTSNNTQKFTSLLTDASASNAKLIELTTALASSKKGRQTIINAANAALNSYRNNIAKENNYSDFKAYVNAMQGKLAKKEIGKADFTRLFSAKIGAKKTKSGQYQDCSIHRTLRYALAKAGDGMNKELALELSKGDDAIINLYADITVSAKKAKTSGTSKAESKASKVSNANSNQSKTSGTSANKSKANKSNSNQSKTSDSLIEAIEKLQDDELSAFISALKSKASDKSTNAAVLIDTLAFSHNKELEKAESMTVTELVSSVAKSANKAQQKSGLQIVNAH